MSRHIEAWKHYIEALRQYANFDGRDPKHAYWSFLMCDMSITWALHLICGGGRAAETHAFLLSSVLPYWFIKHGLAGLSSLYSLATLIPSLAAKVRRLHDTGRSGWYLCVFYGIPLGTGLIVCAMIVEEGGLAWPMLTSVCALLVVLACLAVQYVFLAQASDRGRNRYGPPPKMY